jgi:hypothetical protein
MVASFGSDPNRHRFYSMSLQLETARSQPDDLDILCPHVLDIQEQG